MECQEAHSSQSGEGASKLFRALKTRDITLEEAAREDATIEAEAEDQAERDMAWRKMPENMSAFAFTATPKPRTLELFGEPRPDGTFDAFSLYSMRQAIEEGFILDVLANYTTYHTYWNLRKHAQDDPRYNRRDAQAVLRAYVELHDTAISEKIAVMLDHFHEQTSWQIGGKAKAMIVTRSRMHAIHYKLAVDRVLRERGYPYQTLVAFSGTVKDGDIDYTEASMNGFPEGQTAETFKQPQYRILIVADKYQTGFDQPLLATMYVDKKLGGVRAVQTLSRLNRTYPNKETTFVLDFANDQEEIVNAFAPYYEATVLSSATDPNLLYDTQNNLLSHHVFTEADVTACAAALTSGAKQARIQNLLQPLAERFSELGADEQADFRGQLTDYVRLYAFLAQVVNFTDGDLERLYQFAKLLLKKLPLPLHTLPRDIQASIDLESYHVRQTSRGKLTLPRGITELDPIGEQVRYIAPTEEIDALSAIIADLNQRFGTNFDESDGRCITELEQRLDVSERMTHSAQVNPPEAAHHTFENVVDDLFSEISEGHFKFYQHLNKDATFRNELVSLLFNRYLQRAPFAPDSPM